MIPERTALLIVDLQNDFLHPQGAYARGGVASDEMARLPARIAPLARALEARGGMLAASRFTLWPDARGEPIVTAHLRALRPFLARGDFAAGTWGHAVVDELPRPRVAVYKVAYSAFFNTQLEWVLRHAGVDTVAVAGIVTNGGVASTVRDAYLREFEIVVLADGCAAFRRESHDAALADLAGIARVMRCDAFAAAL